MDIIVHPDVFVVLYGTAVMFLIPILFIKSKNESFKELGYWMMFGFILMIIGISVIMYANGLHGQIMRNNATYEGYATPLNYESVRLPIVDNLSITLVSSHKVKLTNDLFSAFNMLLSNTSNGIIVYDPSVFPRNGNYTKLTILLHTPEGYQNFYKLVKGVEGGVLLMKPLSLDPSLGSTYSRRLYMGVCTGSCEAFYYGYLTISLMPAVNGNEIGKVHEQNILYNISLIPDIIILFVAFLRCILVCYSEIERGSYYISIIPFIFWFIILVSMWASKIVTMPLVKHGSVYIIDSPFVERVQDVMMNKLVFSKGDTSLGKTLVIGDLPEYSKRNPDEIIMTYLPGNILYVGRLGVLSQLPYPALYKGVTNVTLQPNTWVILGNLTLYYKGGYEVVSVNNTLLSNLIKRGVFHNNSVSNVTVNIYVENGKFIYHVHETVNDIGKLLTGKHKVEEWIINSKTPAREIVVKYGLGKDYVHILPLKITGFQWG